MKETAANKSAIEFQCELVSFVFSDKDKTFGLEKLVRKVLSLYAFFYPTLYFRYLFGKKGSVYRKSAVENMFY